MKTDVEVATGYGIRISVDRGHLLIEDGVAGDRRTRRFARIDRDLKRVVAMGHAGTVSLDALRWMLDVGVPFVHIDHDAQLVATSVASETGDPFIRLGQALATQSEHGFALSRELIERKIRGQYELLDDRFEIAASVRAELHAILSRVSEAKDYDALRVLEAQAARLYWSEWSDVPTRFAAQDRRRVPEHWTRFGQRKSYMNNTDGRRAVSPVNAILNYLYAVLEAETRIACMQHGLDPALGIMHVPVRYRDSLALDLMEPVRPLVDRWVLDLLERRTFYKSDFFETREGICRIMPPVARLLSETAPQWGKAVRPIATKIAKTFAQAGRALGVAAQMKSSKGGEADAPVPEIRPSARVKEPARTCEVCGRESENRKYCGGCRSGVENDRSTVRNAKGTATEGQPEKPISYPPTRADNPRKGRVLGWPPIPL